MFVREALTSGRGVKIDSKIASTVNRYRILTRGIRVMDPDVREHWTHTCLVLSASISGLMTACANVGYNVTATRLHVVDESDTIYPISKSLPILIIPVADNSFNGRYVLPPSSGAACVLRVEGGNESPTYNDTWAWGVDREIVESKIQRWLGIGNGRWRHGWLENVDTGVKWYEDMVNTRTEGTSGFRSRRFDATTGTEVDCSASKPQCGHSRFWWGDTLRTAERFAYLQVVLAENGYGDGVFYLLREQTRRTWNLSSLSLILSNISMVILFFHWFVTRTALHHYYRHHFKEVQLTGIGILSNTQTIRVLPFVLLSRLRVALTTFFTVGCAFEGDQLPRFDAWFIVYPGIAEVVLFVFSSLNLIAKLLKRRVSDVLFGPTLAILCLLHFLRQPLADSTWLGYEGLIPTVITASEYKDVSLVDFFTSEVVLRINGNVKVLFIAKLILLGINLIPLLFSHSTSVKLALNSHRPMSLAEQTLALRPWLCGGLGRCSPSPLGVISPYELVRHGYIVYGDLVVVSITDWYYILLMCFCGRSSSDLTLRLLVQPIVATASTREDGNLQDISLRYTCGGTLRFVPASDPLILAAHPWEITVVQLQ